MTPELRRGVYALSREELGVRDGDEDGTAAPATAKTPAERKAEKMAGLSEDMRMMVDEGCMTLQQALAMSGVEPAQDKAEGEGEAEGEGPVRLENLLALQARTVTRRLLRKVLMMPVQYACRGPHPPPVLPVAGSG